MASAPDKSGQGTINRPSMVNVRMASEEESDWPSSIQL